MLSGVNLALVGDLTSVNRVREQPIDVPARKRLATALTAVCRRAALGLEPELVGCLLDTPHTTELTVKRKDLTHRLGLGRVDDQGPPAGVIAERHVATHP